MKRRRGKKRRAKKNPSPSMTAVLGVVPGVIVGLLAYYIVSPNVESTTGRGWAVAGLGGGVAGGVGGYYLAKKD